MPPSPTSTGDGNSIADKLRNLVQPPKIQVRISLHRRKRIYTTLDKLDGHISIVAPVDTTFDAIQIEFLGTVKTYIERVTSAAAVSGRSEAFHQFLKLEQPRLRQFYPQDSILKAGQTYELPFIFAIPRQLLLRTCVHKTQTPLVRDAHLQVPPSFGDRDFDGCSDEFDDLAPEMASIRYGVFARILRFKTVNGETYPSNLASKVRKVRVMPVVDDEPPLVVGGEESDYVMRRERTIRKSVLKGKLGMLVMEAVQPQSLRIEISANPDSRTTTVVTINLRFDPTDDTATPPKLGSLVSKLKVTTFFASTARQTFPSKHASLLDLSQGMHTEQLTLSSRSMANVDWTKRDPPPKSAVPHARHDSCDSDSPTAPSATYQGASYYTARLLVPMTLPLTKAFVPTFHSCLISRTYQLRLDLGVHTAGINPSMDLKIPVQISACPGEGDGFPLTRRGSIDSADAYSLDAEDAEDLFGPRTERPPSPGSSVSRSRISSQAPVDEDTPPDYSPYSVPGS